MSELRNKLEKHNLPTTGIKQDLIARLKEHTREHAVQESREENRERRDNLMQREIEILTRERDAEKREKDALKRENKALQQGLALLRRAQPGPHDARGSVRLENAVQPSSTQSSVVSSVEGNAHSSTPTNIVNLAKATTSNHLRKIYNVLDTVCTEAALLDAMPEIPDDSPPQKVYDITKVMRSHINKLNVPDISTEISSIIISKMGRKRREAWDQTRTSRNPEIEDILKFLEENASANYNNQQPSTSSQGSMDQGVKEMDLSKINAVAKMAAFLPTKKLTELDRETDYQITNLKFVHTKIGESVVAEIYNEFTVFLPARIAKAFKEDRELFRQMVESSRGMHLYMVYHGENYNSIQFKKL